MWISRKSCEILKQGIDSGKKDIYCSGLHLSAKWFVAGKAACKNVHVIVLPDSEEAQYCASDLYGIVEGDNVFYLPSSGKNIEKSNYKSSLSVQRTSAVNKLRDNKKSDDLLFIVTYPEALEEFIPSLDDLNKSLILKKGMEISHENIKEKLYSLGFEKVDFVGSPGQYAIRGSIVDIFSYSDNHPYRISFFGNEIEKILSFDCNTQLSGKQYDEAEISQNVGIYGGESGISIFDILPENCTFWLDSSDLYREREFYSKYLEDYQKVYMEVPAEHKKDVMTVNFKIYHQPVFNKNFELLSSDIKNKLEHGYKVYIYAEKENQIQRLKSILSGNYGFLPDFVHGKSIHGGFIDGDDKICCYSDHEIFDRYQRVYIRKTVEKSEQLTLNDISSFNIGDYIVHIDHGVGIFGGLVRMLDDKGRYNEVVKLMYKDNDVVFVSIHSLHKIAKYKSKDSVPPKIHSLGSKSWNTLKNNAKSKVKDIAKELIRIYAKRKSSKGFAFSPDNYLQEELESSFIYEDTYDQQSATLAVKRDMESPGPMDRLICGDVGFGKTEIAIRAAFKAVNDSKQVVVLVPTTILALQHYNTFKNRLKNLPCNVDYVSRLRTPGQIKEIKQNIREGKTDIIIGTHKLLSKDFEFKDLGLLIIDEEQKFGVSAKEKLRELKSSVDTLTLTATPIPRTLQFSLLGARDLSIISTPPPNRIPVQTEIIIFDEDEIRDIINYELGRGGQIFFIHNRVEELESVHEILRRLVPDTKICLAHGRMESKVLENRLLDFIQGDYDILLCTTIIESGIDIPNANTIIINQAQNFGLSDLHQLRGRVGRANRKAFCYLIVPPMTTLSEDSRRRLKAIEEFSDLGSGFNISMQDLDIRGAGNLLGAEQSGFIADMGYETYQKILSEAMEELGMETYMSEGPSEEKINCECTIDTDIPALIPDDYIDITSEKIRLYKEIDSLKREHDFDDLRNKMTDRFGHIPEETDNLFYVVKIRNLGEKGGFEKIIIKNGIMICFFISNQMSSFYRSDSFEKILKNINDSSFELKQTEGKLKLVARNIKSLSAAHSLVKKIVNW